MFIFETKRLFAKHQREATTKQQGNEDRKKIPSNGMSLCRMRIRDTLEHLQNGMSKG